MMKTLFKMFQSMGKSQKRLLKIIGVFFLVCIIIVLVLGVMNNRTHSYESMESKLLAAGKKYYNDNKDTLPMQEGGKVSIHAEKLIELEYMKEFTKYNKNAESCSGVVTVMNNAGQYLYIPSLKCEDYKTQTLYDKILEDQVVTEGDGIYQMYGDSIFRGEYPNNYVRFANQMWRIMRLTNEKEIRLVQVKTKVNGTWDNRYNIQTNKNSGITDYEISRLSAQLQKLYEESFSENDKSYIISKNLCIGTRKEKETRNDGSVECSTLTKKKYPVGTVQVNEYMIPSLDSNCKFQTDSSCTNYNYMTKFDKAFWSITTSNLNSYQAYFIDYIVERTDASRTKYYQMVIHVNGEIPFKGGKGTEEEPYEIY